MTVERISEALILPAINQVIDLFPFKIQGFHADNGGEYINYTIAAQWFVSSMAMNTSPNTTLANLVHSIKLSLIAMSASIDLVISQQPSSIAKVKKEKSTYRRVALPINNVTSTISLTYLLATCALIIE